MIQKQFSTSNLWKDIRLFLDESNLRDIDVYLIFHMSIYRI